MFPERWQDWLIAAPSVLIPLGILILIWEAMKWVVLSLWSMA